MTPKQHIRPSLQLLDPDQMQEVHRYSIRILEDTGIQVESKAARRVFEKSEAINIRNDRIYIQEDLVQHAISLAPSNIELYNKSGDLVFYLGEKQGNDTHFGIGVTNTWFQDIESSRVELFTRKHMQDSTSLGDLLDNYAMVSTPGIPSDVNPEESDLYATLDMYANTGKPLVLLVSGENKLNEVFELLNFLHGDLSARPFCIPYVNPITPLVLNRSTTDKMVATINQGLPLMYSNYSMYGGTTPVTEGGTLALLNAELLAGLVFSQLVKEGSPIILGSLPAAFNMSTMGSSYTPASYLLNLACAEMMSFYELPHCGTSGSNNGRGPDLLASGDLWLNHLSSCIGKVGCAPFVGGNFDSLAFSPATVVLSDHIIGEAKKFAGGFTLNDKTVNLGEISNTGPGGNFFTSYQTLNSLHDLSAASDIWPSMSMDAWKERQMPSAEKALIEYTSELYTRAQNAAKDRLDLIKRGEEFIRNSLLR